MARKIERRAFFQYCSLILSGLVGANLLAASNQAPVTPKPRSNEPGGSDNRRRGSAAMEQQRDRWWSYDDTLGIEIENRKEVTFNELAALSIRLGRVYNALDLLDWRIDPSPEFITGLAEEAADQILVEGISDELVIPAELNFFHPENAYEINHVFGRTSCIRDIHLNSRFRNPASSLYQDPRIIGTVVHEEIHLVQAGICYGASSEIVEATAQLGMLEVLASMAVRGRGNKIAFNAFVMEAYPIADGALMAIALQQNRVAEYEKIRSLTETTAIDWAREERFWRDFAGRDAQLAQLLTKYELLPMQLLFQAHLNNYDLVEGLALAPSLAEDLSHAPDPYRPRPLAIDDWAYVMKNLEKLAAYYISH